ncbi:hypothetical protein BHE74_00010799 [Ensete ventricosum]|nr:hypothetical protein GW17_00003932 [Ensete ventricosum]RWW80841.1 hypothetical protein BHE74_00010799 [Ensete ventricosum]RZS05311.1 hypothetical protein BHM03_00035800 [Ensete ventricosum]
MYRSTSRLVHGLPAIGRYRRLGLFPPHYHPKVTGNGRFRTSPSATGWYQSREKEEEGEEKRELGDPALLSLDDPNPSPPRK